MTNINDWINPLLVFMSTPLWATWGGRITPWFIFQLIFFLWLLFFGSSRLRYWVAGNLLANSRLDIGARQTAGAIARYIVLIAGFLIIVQTAGIDLTTFNVLAGAVGIGVGFGLQNVVSNFISGLIILFERPIKVGDRVEVSGIDGKVMEINGRSTTILTNDNIAIIVPNSRFISENVVNWKYNDSVVRFRIPVGVAYGSDVRLVERVLLEAANEEEEVLETPPPVVRFLAFGDSSLNFELRAWTVSAVNRKGRIVSKLNFAIYEKFAANNIEIPFPQRDLHIKSGTLTVRKESDLAE